MSWFRQIGIIRSAILLDGFTVAPRGTFAAMLVGLVAFACSLASADDSINLIKQTQERAYQLEAEGKRLEAIQEMATAEQLAESNQHEEVLPEIRIFLATQRVRAGQLNAAEKTIRQMLEHDRATRGEEDWRTKAWGCGLKYIDQLRNLDLQQRQQVLKADATLPQIVPLIQSGDASAAVELATSVLEVYEKFLPPDEAEVIEARAKLGRALQAAGNPVLAIPHLRAALKRYPELYSEEHPSLPPVAKACSFALRDQAKALKQSGKTEEALKLLREAVDTLTPYVDPWDTALNEARYKYVLVMREQQPIERPGIEELLKDDFETDSRDLFQSNAQLEWQPGLLQISDGIAVRPFSGSRTTTLQFRLSMVETAEPEEGHFCWGFQLGRNGTTTIGIYRLRTPDGFTDELQVEEGVWDGQKWVFGLNRRWRLPEGAAQGTWKVRFDHGLLKISNDQEGLWYTGLYHNQQAPVIGILFKANGSLGGQISQLQVTGPAPRVLTEDETQLTNACQAYDQAERQVLNAGDYEQAYQLRTVSHRYRRVLYGTQDVQFAFSLKALGYLLDLRGQPRDAHDCFQQGLEILQLRLGDIHPDTAALWNNLGYTSARLGQYDDAIVAYKTSLKSLELTRGVEDDLTATTLSNLGQAYWAKGQNEVGREYIQRALVIRRKVGGNDSLKVADSLGLLAQYYINKEEPQAALPLAEECLQIRQKLHKDGHPSIAQAQRFLASVYHQLGETEKARTYAQAALEFSVRQFGTGHEQSRDAERDLDLILADAAQIAEESGDLEKAAELIDERCRNKFWAIAPDHWEIAILKEEAEQLRRLASADQKVRTEYKNALQLSEKSRTLTNSGNHQAALEAQRNAVDIFKRLLPDNSKLLADACVTLGDCYLQLNEFASAEQATAQAVEIAHATLGPNHPTTLIIQLKLAHAYLQNGKLEEAINTLQKVKPNSAHQFTPDETANHQIRESWTTVTENLSLAFEKSRRWEEAHHYRQQLFEAMQLQYGDQHWKTADAQRALNQIELLRQLDEMALKDLDRATEHFRQSNEAETAGDWARSLQLRRDAYDLRKRHLGEFSVLTAALEYELGRALKFAGNLREAGRVNEHLLQVRLKTLGPLHPLTATAWHQVATSRYQNGDLRGSFDAATQARSIEEQLGQTQTADYAATLNTLASVLMELADDREAAALFQQVGDLLLKIEGPKGQRYALARSNLASAYGRLRDSRYVDTLTEATELVKTAFGESHPEYAVMLDKMAPIRMAAGHMDQAQEMAQNAVRIKQKYWGPHHPSTLTSRAYVANLLDRQGKTDEAIDELQQVLDETDTTDQNYPARCSSLAILLQKAGRHSEAIELQLRSVDASLENFLQVSTVQSERQQLELTAEFLTRLHRLLDMDAAEQSSTEQIYQRLLAWKGIVLQTQRNRRRLAENRELQPILLELRNVTRRLAALQNLPEEEATKETRRAHRKALQMRRNELEIELSKHARSLGAEHRDISVEMLQEQIPEATVLIDYFVYQGRSRTDSDDGQRVVAFIVPAAGPVIREELGPAQEIGQLIESWRREIMQGTGITRGDRRVRIASPKAPQRTDQLLREKLWTPVERHLQNIHVVMISPDGILAKMPFAALPGATQDSRLIENYSLLSLPSAQILFDQTSPQDHPEDMVASICLVGGVDFSGSPADRTANVQSRVALRSARSGLMDFSPLPGTLTEVEAIQQLMHQSGGQSTLLTGTDASEEALREAVARKRYLHFATHGYFQPRDSANNAVETSADALLPGLQSGLALAGANRGGQFSLVQMETSDDGLLTALEAAELDLEGTELVVLSACETGLGKVAGGEGLLGLQRAFHLAGAQTVVATLWQVDDEATRALMVAFYQNLWNRNMDRLEALRQAQIALMRGELYRPPGLKNRDGPLPPRYWAAFVLSGAHKNE